MKATKETRGVVEWGIIRKWCIERMVNQIKNSGFEVENMNIVMGNNQKIKF